MQTWADMFGWSRAKTRRYFEKLEKINVIMLLAHKRTTHIRVINYDLWTGVRKDAYKKDPNYEKEFQEFWDYYHETTQMRKVNIARAKKEWSMLMAFSLLSEGQASTTGLTTTSSNPPPMA